MERYKHISNKEKLARLGIAVGITAAAASEVVGQENSPSPEGTQVAYLTTTDTLPTPEKLIGQEGFAITNPAFRFEDGLDQAILEKLSEVGESSLSIEEFYSLISSEDQQYLNNNIASAMEFIENDPYVLNKEGLSIDDITPQISFLEAEGRLYGSLEFVHPDGSQTIVYLDQEGNQYSYSYLVRNENEKISRIATKLEGGEVDILPVRKVELDGQEYIESFLVTQPNYQAQERAASTFVVTGQFVNIRNEFGQDVGDAYNGDSMPALNYTNSHVPGLPNDMVPLPQDNGNIYYVASEYGQLVSKIEDIGSEVVVSPEILAGQMSLERYEGEYGPGYKFIDQEGIEHDVPMLTKLMARFDSNSDNPREIRRPDMGIYRINENTPGRMKYMISGVLLDSQITTITNRENLGNGVFEEREMQVLQVKILVPQDDGSTVIISANTAPRLSNPLFNNNISVSSDGKGSMSGVSHEDFNAAANQYIGHNVAIATMNSMPDQDLQRLYEQRYGSSSDEDCLVTRLYGDYVRDTNSTFDQFTSGSLREEELNVHMIGFYSPQIFSSVPRS